MTADAPEKPTIIGINHVALEVGDVDEALAFYGKIFRVHLRGRGNGAAFIDMGDQFLALMEGPVEQPRGHRHFGLVVDDRTEVRRLAEAAGATILPGGFLDFLDPWGNRVEVVAYADIQFTKADFVLRALNVTVEKSDKACRELSEKFVGAPVA